MGFKIGWTAVVSAKKKLALNIRTNRPYTSLDHFFLLTIFGYAQPCCAILNGSQSGYGPRAIKR